MSQHIYNTTFQDRPVSIVTGWDRPTREFFLQIRRADEPQDDEDEIVYSTIEDVNAYGACANQVFIAVVLLELGIKVPGSMITESAADAEHNRGNRIAIHSDAGFEG
jgi:hypothetical protein